VKLIVEAVSEDFRVHSSALDVQSFARSAFAYIAQVQRNYHVSFFNNIILQQILHAEIDLFACIFFMPEDDACFRILLEPMMSIFHDLIRPRYILLNDIFAIAELIEVITEEMSDKLRRFGRAGGVFHPFMQNLLADVQERLIFRAQTFIKEKVEDYKPSRDDLIYVREESQSQANNSLGEQKWFSPLQNTLFCLATMYRCLDSHTFSGLATEVVQVCTESIVRASRVGPVGLHDADAHLFAIKNLLILREQISPFESDLLEHSMSMRDLDLAHMRGEVHRMFSGETNIFSSPQGQNVFPVPRVIKSNLDSRKRLDQYVRIACETYIMFFTRQIVDPMLAFLTKVTALRASDSLSQELSISSLAFATPDRLADIVLQVNNALAQKLPKLINRMKMFIASTVSRDMILNAIKNNLVEAHSQFAGLVESEYGEQALSEFDLKLPSELAALLDAS